jgi:membrane-bound ClpP family serine protease
MSKTYGESAALFRPLLVAGIIILAFGIICIWIGTDVISLKEEGEGFKIIGIRFLVGAAVSIGLGFLAKYFTLVMYILRQLFYKRKPEEDKYSGWHKP